MKFKINHSLCPGGLQDQQPRSNTPQSVNSRELWPLRLWLLLPSPFSWQGAASGAAQSNKGVRPLAGSTGGLSGRAEPQVPPMQCQDELQTLQRSLCSRK